MWMEEIFERMQAIHSSGWLQTGTSRSPLLHTSMATFPTLSIRYHPAAGFEVASRTPHSGNPRISFVQPLVKHMRQRNKKIVFTTKRSCITSVASIHNHSCISFTKASASAGNKKDSDNVFLKGVGSCKRQKRARESLKTIRICASLRQ